MPHLKVKDGHLRKRNGHLRFCYCKCETACRCTDRDPTTLSLHITGWSICSGCQYTALVTTPYGNLDALNNILGDINGIWDFTSGDVSGCGIWSKTFDSPLTADYFIGTVSADLCSIVNTVGEPANTNINLNGKIKIDINFVSRRFDIYWLIGGGPFGISGTTITLMSGNLCSYNWNQGVNPEYISGVGSGLCIGSVSSCNATGPGCNDRFTGAGGVGAMGNGGSVVLVTG